MASLDIAARLNRLLASAEGRGMHVAITVVAVAALAVVSSLLNVALVPVLVAGTQTGVVYALVAVGIALIYKSTRVLNFAQGEIGTIAAFTVFMFLTGFDRDASLASSYPFGTMLGWTLVAVVLGAVLGILINVGVVARLADAAPVTSLVATIGVALLLAGSEVLYFEAVPRPYPQFAVGAPQGFEVFGMCFASSEAGTCLGSEGVLVLGGAIITYQFIITTVVLLLVAVGLAALFRTPVGIALLASSQEPYAAQLQGVSLRTMSALAWGTAGAFGALAGVLAAGSAETIFPGFMTATVLIPAIVAAVLGGITSIPGAVVGALILGFVQSFANDAVLANGWQVPGPPQMAAFAVLLLVLLLRPQGLLGKGV